MKNWKKVISTKLTPETIAQLESIASSKGVTKSTLVAQIIERHLKRG